MRRALNRENDDTLRESIIVALAELGGFADAEALAALAALLAGRVTLTPGERAVCVLSGGNVEWDGLQELLANG